MRPNGKRRNKQGQKSINLAPTFSFGERRNGRPSNVVPRHTRVSRNRFANAKSVSVDRVFVFPFSRSTRQRFVRPTTASAKSRPALQKRRRNSARTAATLGDEAKKKKKKTKTKQNNTSRTGRMATPIDRRLSIVRVASHRGVAGVGGVGRGGSAAWATPAVNQYADCRPSEDAQRWPLGRFAIVSRLGRR